MSSQTWELAALMYRGVVRGKGFTVSIQIPQVTLNNDVQMPIPALLAPMTCLP
jgi:hypothetical protein